MPGMRMLSVGLLAIVLTAALEAQAGSGRGRPPDTAVTAKLDGDLNQLMRGMLFPSSNILFDAQKNDPGEPQKKVDTPGSGAIQTYANVYAGWPAAEGAAVAIAESADLMLKPGRICSNGKPAPVTRPDYIKFAEELRLVGRKALAAATAKNRDELSDVTNDLADACLNCHQVYRDTGRVGSSQRCGP